MKDFYFESRRIGHFFETPTAYGFFGNKYSSLETLKSAFPNFTFFELNQVHGADIISVKEPIPPSPGDGLITTQKKFALAIQTADCLPVLITDGTQVAALHAGWRGIEKRIVMRALENFEKRVRIYIGPHIHKSSYEIDQEVAQLLEKATISKNTYVTFQNQRKKYYADLAAIVKKQADDTPISLDHFEELKIDTMRDQNYASFRRDRNNAGRQFSFIVLK